MQKYTVKIDVSRLNKDKFRRYSTKDGNEVIEASVDVIIMDEDRHTVVTKKDLETEELVPIQGDGWRLEKVGFSAETPSKEEKANMAEPNYLGNVETFKNTSESTGDSQVNKETDKSEGVDEINPDDIPF